MVTVPKSLYRTKNSTRQNLLLMLYQNFWYTKIWYTKKWVWYSTLPTNECPYLSKNNKKKVLSFLNTPPIEGIISLFKKEKEIEALPGDYGLLQKNRNITLFKKKKRNRSEKVPEDA